MLGVARPGAAESTEEQERLLSLAQQDATGGTAAAGAILQKLPPWKDLEDSQVLKKGAADKLERLHHMSGDAKAVLLDQDPDIIKAMTSALKVMDLKVIQYVVILLYAIIRDDGSRFDTLLRNCSPDEVSETFHKLLSRTDLDEFTSDRAASLYTGFVCHGGPDQFKEESIERFLSSIHGGVYRLSEHGKLDAYCNLLKADYCRELVWNTRGVSEAVMKNLDPTASTPNLYRASFCVWLLCFRKDLMREALKKGLLTHFCSILAECRVEKIIRLCINTLLELMNEESAVEELLERNTVQMVQLLEYEKWRDPELGDTIRKALSGLQSKVKQHSNFDRYDKEVSTGKLSWSHLHQEKFFHENIESFGVDDFKVVKQLVKLLATDEPETVAVACHDLGEFVRLYPTGKRVLERLKAKQFLLMLLSHKNKEISTQALLCVQKLMLRRWQDAASETTPPLVK